MSRERVPQDRERNDALLTLPDTTRVASVTSTYHSDVTGPMRDSARACLEAAGLSTDNILEISVPGAWELVGVARRLARRTDIDAVLCFGLVLRGETSHDRWISGAVAHGLMRAGEEFDKPVSFGLLTCNTLEQAKCRASTGEGGLDKGCEVARATILQLHCLAEASE